MKRSASAVITTRSSHPCLVSRLARSAARWAAMDPVTPKTMFLLIPPLLEFRRLRSRRTHLLRFNDRLHPAQILLNRGTNQQIIKILPLGDFLTRNPKTLLNGRLGIRPAFSQA